MNGFIDTFLTITINYNPFITAHSQWMLETRSIPCWPTRIFSSTVTDLVLIYESIASSASVVCWLALHIWTLNCWTAFSVLLHLNHKWTDWTCEPITSPIYNSGWTEWRSRPETAGLLFGVYLLLQNIRPSRSNALISTNISITADTHFSHPFSSNGLFQLSGVISEYSCRPLLLSF
jgi:hypothetical protein